MIYRPLDLAMQRGHKAPFCGSGAEPRTRGAFLPGWHQLLSGWPSDESNIPTSNERRTSLPPCWLSPRGLSISVITNPSHPLLISKWSDRKTKLPVPSATNRTSEECANRMTTDKTGSNTKETNTKEASELKDLTPENQEKTHPGSGCS